VTLAATDGNQNDNGDPILATISAANILANLNHGVSYWTHWVWDQLSNYNTGEPNTRMKYIQQIGRNMPEGAVMRRCTADDSQPTPDMFWNYFDLDNPDNFIQPEIVAAASMNPDTTMTIAVVNLAGVRAQHFYSELSPLDISAYQVSLQVKDMAEFSSIRATPITCSNNGNVSEGDPMEIIYGGIDFPIASRDLVVLRTGKLAETPSTSPGRLYSPSDIAFASYPNPFIDETRITAELEACRIQVRIFNIQGKPVFKGIGELHPGGKYEFTWNAADQPSGIYISEISVTRQVETSIHRIKMLKK
jgi:hypothetical protein